MERVITNVRLLDEEGLWNVGIQSGSIAAMTRQPLMGQDYLHGNGRLLTPGLVETHLHLDKALTQNRVSWEQERPKGTAYRRFQEELTAALKRSFTEDDIICRATKVCQMAVAAGTTMMRGQGEVDAFLGLDAIRALLKVKERVRDYLDLQIIAFPLGNFLEEPGLLDLVREALALGADGVGGVPEIVPEEVDAYLDPLFRLAAEFGGVVDVHVDQPQDERLFSFPIMVEKARTYGLEGRVTGAHANSLWFQPPERVVPVLETMRETGVHLSCLPYGHIKERIQVPKAMGVHVSLINDNVQDPWQRGGCGDLIQIGMIYARTGAVRSDAGLREAFDMLSVEGAAALGVTDYGAKPGARADLLLFNADTIQDVISQAIGPEAVLKRGRVVAQDGRMCFGTSSR